MLIDDDGGGMKINVDVDHDDYETLKSYDRRWYYYTRWGCIGTRGSMTMSELKIRETDCQGSFEAGFHSATGFNFRHVNPATVPITTSTGEPEVNELLSKQLPGKFQFIPSTIQKERLMIRINELTKAKKNDGNDGANIDDHKVNFDEDSSKCITNQEKEEQKNVMATKRMDPKKDHDGRTTGGSTKRRKKVLADENKSLPLKIPIRQQPNRNCKNRIHE